MSRLRNHAQQFAFEQQTAGALAGRLWFGQVNGQATNQLFTMFFFELAHGQVDLLRGF